MAYALLFPAVGRRGIGARTATAPMPLSRVQQAFRGALREAGIHKDARVHTLRHSYAPHLREAGVNLRQIQESLGYNSPQVTAQYTHLTTKGMADAYDAINALMPPL